MVFAVPVFAEGSVSVKPNKSSVEVGDSVSVTITFSGGDSYIGGVTATVTFDPSVLKYQSSSDNNAVNISNGSGKIVLEESSQSKTTVSLTLKFSAVGAGSTDVSISGTDLVDSDANTIGSPSGKKTITVNSKKEETKPADNKKEDDKKEETKPADNTDNKKEEQQEEIKEPTDIEQAIKVSVDGADRYLWRSLKNVKVPDDFETKTLVYNGEQIQAASNTGLDLNLLYFTDEKGENGEFLVFNGFEDFEKLITLSANDSTYAVLEKGDEDVLPGGYEARTETVLETEGIKVFSSLTDPDYYYLYLGNLKTGEKGFYQFDRKELSLQRVNGDLLDAKIELENMPEPVEPSIVEPVEPSEPIIVEPEPEPEEKGLVDRILSDDDILLTMIGIIGLAFVIVAIMTSAMIISKKKRKQQLKAEKAKKDAEEDLSFENNEDTENLDSEETQIPEEETEGDIETTDEADTEEVSDMTEEIVEEGQEAIAETEAAEGTADVSENVEGSETNEAEDVFGDPEDDIIEDTNVSEE